VYIRSYHMSDIQMYAQESEHADSNIHIKSVHMCTHTLPMHWHTSSTQACTIPASKRVAQAARRHAHTVHRLHSFKPCTDTGVSHGKWLIVLDTIHRFSETPRIACNSHLIVSEKNVVLYCKPHPDLMCPSVRPSVRHI